MKKKIFSLISIFIFCFSLSFSFFDRVSFAADPVTFNVSTYDGKHFSFEGLPDFSPFVIYSHIADGNYNNSYIIVSNGPEVKFHGDIAPSHLDHDMGTACIGYWFYGIPKNSLSVDPNVIVVDKDFNSFNEQCSYIRSLIKDPSQLPINVTTYDNSLGSLQLKDSTSWRLLRYEPILDDEPASLPNIFKVKLRAEFQDTTSTGQSYDKIQVMVRVKNIRSQFLAANTYPWKNKFSKDEYYSYYLTDLKSPTTVDLQTHDYTKREEDGHINFNISYPLFQPCIDHFALTKPIFANDDWFLCDYTVCYRPVTTDGKFGDWFYITPDNNYLGHNIDGNSSSISATTGTSLSDSDPNSLSFNPLPEDSTSSRTAIGKGSTLENAIANSNNSLVGGGLTGGGSLTSNITDLFSFFTNMPSIISTIFGWLPPWVLSLFAIGFALFVPIFIYKFVRG